MTSAEDIENEMENVSVMEDMFDDDEEWGDENDPPPSSYTEGSKRGRTMAPALTPIHEESRVSSRSLDYDQKDDGDFNEPTDSTQARTPAEPSPVDDESIVFKHDSFVPVSNVSDEIRRNDASLIERNRFRVPDARDNERRSWEGKSHDTDAMGSLIIPKSGQSSLTRSNSDRSNRSNHSTPKSYSNSSRRSKMITSTPKGQGRSQDNSFEDCPVSTIQSASPMNATFGSLMGSGGGIGGVTHTGSTLSNSAIGKVLKNVDMEGDSVDMATQFVSKDTHIRSKDTQLRSRDISKKDLNGMSGYQIYKATGMVPKKSFRKKESTFEIDPRLEQISNTLNAIERAQSLRSSRSDRSLAPSSSKDTSKISSAREPLNSSRTDKTFAIERPMSAKPRSPTSSDPSAVIAVKPYPYSHFGFVPIGQSIVLAVTVTNLSKEMIRVQAELKEGVFSLLEKSLVIINGNDQYNFLIKFTPDQRARYKSDLYLKVPSSDKTVRHGLIGFGGSANLKVCTNKCLRMCPELSYVMFPRSPLSFTFDVANDGERAGFAVVTAVDDDNNVIHGVSIKPEKFVLLTSENAKAYNEKWEQTVTVTVRPEALRTLHDRARSTNGRLSTISRVSGSSEPRHSINNNAHLFNLKIVWGDERFRQRAKKYITMEKAPHPVIHGIPITKMTLLDNEDSTMQKNNDGFLSEQDVNTLQAQICVTTIRVGDQRAMPGTSQIERLSSRPSSSASNHSLPEGFYIPRHVPSDMNVSTISVAPSVDRTVMPSKSKRY